MHVSVQSYSHLKLSKFKSFRVFGFIQFPCAPSTISSTFNSQTKDKYVNVYDMNSSCKMIVHSSHTISGGGKSCSVSEQCAHVSIQAFRISYGMKNTKYLERRLIMRYLSFTQHVSHAIQCQRHLYHRGVERNFNLFFVIFKKFPLFTILSHCHPLMHANAEQNFPHFFANWFIYCIILCRRILKNLIHIVYILHTHTFCSWLKYSTTIENF